MSYRLVADVAVVLHFGFLVFLVVGGLAALRWRRLVWPHVLAVAWSVGIVTVGQPCPLTTLERWATGRAGRPVPDQGFIDRYVEDVVYPGSLTGPVRAAVAAVVVVSWLALCFPPVRRRLLHHRASLVAPPARLAARIPRSSVQPGVGAASPAPSLRSEGLPAGASAAPSPPGFPRRSSGSPGGSPPPLLGPARRRSRLAGSLAALGWREVRAGRGRRPGGRRRSDGRRGLTGGTSAGPRRPR